MTQYDVVIVGAGVAGLSVGALLVKEGKKVLILEKAKEVGGRLISIEYEGQIIDNGVHGPAVDGFLEAIFAGVGKPFPEIVSDLRTVVYKDGRFQELPAPRDELRRFMKEEVLAKSYAELEEYEDIPLDEWARDRMNNEGMHAWLAIMGMLWCPSDRYENVSAGDLLLRLKEVMERRKLQGSTGFALGGTGGLYKPLAEYILENGGEIRTGTLVSEIVIEDGKACGVLIDKGPRLFPAHIVDTEVIEAPEVVCTLPIWDLFKVIPEDVFSRWYVDWVKHIQHKVAYVMGIYAAVDTPVLGDERLYCWVPDAPRMKRLTTMTCFTSQPGLGEKVGQYQVAFNMQTLYDRMPDLFAYDQAKTRRDLRKIFDELEEDVKEYFPDWEKHCLWKMRYCAPIDIAMSPGLVGKHRPDRTPPGVKNLYFVGDTLRREKGNWTQTSAYEAIICAKQILGKEPV